VTVPIAEAVQHSIGFIELWRTLGGDYAAWDRRMPDGAPLAFREGYAAGQAKPKAKNPDRFVRKWLQVRYNALKRERVVDEKVTEDFLKEIDVPICPVTLVPLTYGERKESDWSIDRVNNDGAYAPGNLIVISTKANKAKGNKTFEEVETLALQNSVVEELKPKEWLRLAVLMQGACAVRTRTSLVPMPLVTRIPQNCFRSEWLQMQHVIHVAASKRSERKKLERWTNHILDDDESGKRRLSLLIDNVGGLRNETEYEYDVWATTKVKRLFVDWLRQMSPQRQLAFRQAASQLAGGHAIQDSEIEALKLDSYGRLPK